MNGFRRGTTPLITCNLGIAQTDISAMWVTFSQKGAEVFTKTLADVDWEEKTFSFRLTQENTLAFKGNEVVEIQLRLLMVDTTALASAPIAFLVTDVKKAGVIS